MKKTPCSLGQYVLRNVEQTRGMEGYGYYAELWKGKKFIGTLEDYGDGGGVNPRLDYKMTAEEKQAISEELLKDMRDFLEITNTSPKSLAASYWLKSPSDAMEGFGETLLELTELVKVSKKLDKKANGGAYVILQTGLHWLLSNDEGIYSTEMAGFVLGSIPKSEYDKVIKMQLQSQLPKGTKITMLKYIEKPIKWSLSFKDYASMLDKAREFNK